MTVVWWRLAARIGLGMLFLIVAAVAGGRLVQVGEVIAYLEQRQIAWNIIIRDLDRNTAYNLSALIGMNAVRNRLPQWSPDGTQLAFISERDGGLDIFLTDPGGRSLRVLTHTRQLISAYDWSSDGSRIVFDLTQRGRQLHTVNVETGELQQLLPRNNYRDIIPKWSARGDIAFISDRNSGSDLYLLPADGGEPRQMTYELALTGYLTWSPDGTWIAFTAIDLTPSITPLIFSDIYILNVTQSSPTRIKISGNEAWLMWSPDGERIAFIGDGSGNEELFVMDRDGANLRQLTNNYFPDYAPVWSPDGTRLLWVSAPDYGTSELYLLDIANGDWQQLTANRINDWSPVWKP